MKREWQEAVDVIGQPQKESLKALCPQKAAGSPRGELLLDGREDALYQGPRR